jgi:lactoylglutathione lyase
MPVALRKISAISLFVDDVARSKAWYQRVFGLTIVYEDENSAVIEFDNTVVNLLARREANGLIGPAPVARSNGGAEAQFSLWIDDVDAACKQLEETGVELINGPMDRPWGMRTACFADPDGHNWEIAQNLS